MDYTITIPSNCVDDLVNGICYDFGYQENVPDSEGGTIPNPESKNDFAKRIHKEWLRQKYIDERVRSNDAVRATLVNTATTEAEDITVS